MDMNETKPVDLTAPKIDPMIMDAILAEKHDALKTIDAELDKVKNDLQILAAITNAVDVETATLAQTLIEKGIVSKEDLQATYKIFVDKLKENAAKMAEEAKAAQPENTPA